MGLTYNNYLLKEKLNDVALNVRDFIAKAASVAEGIQDALNYCYENSLPLLIEDAYTVTSNLAHFHDVRKVGVGRITSNDNVWYITPMGAQKNTVYVTAAGNATNDGISSTNGVTHQRAWDIMSSIGEKASDGNWEIVIVGTIQHDGVVLPGMPNFKNRLVLTGQVANNVNTSTIDGTNATRPYALRMEEKSYNKFFTIKNINFTNWWTGDSNKGAITCWHNTDVLISDCQFNNCGRGVWLRHGAADMTDCTFTDVFYPIYVQYHMYYDIVGCTFTASSVVTNSVGVHVGRLSGGYVNSCTFTNYYIHIEAVQSSRIRTISNTYNTYGHSALRLGYGAVWNENTEEAPTFASGVLTQSTPAVSLYTGGLDGRLGRGTAVYQNVNVAPENTFTISNTTEAVMLTGLNPLRIPVSFFRMSGNKARICMSLSASIGEFDIILCGQAGPGGTGEMLRIPVESATGGFKGQLELDILSARPGTQTGYYHAKIIGENKIIVAKSDSVAFNSSHFAALSEEIKAFRFYIQPKSTSVSVNVYHVDSVVSSIDV